MELCAAIGRAPDNGVIQQDPFIVTVIQEETPEASVGDIIIGALGLTGVMFLSALVLGAVVAVGLVLWHRRFRPEDDHLPPISPSISQSGDVPPSSPTP